MTCHASLLIQSDIRILERKVTPHPPACQTKNAGVSAVYSFATIDMYHEHCHLQCVYE